MAKGINDIDVIIKDMYFLSNETIKNAAWEIMDLLQSSPPIGTPIDTEWASSNWHFSVDTPADVVVGSKKNVIENTFGEADVAAFDIEVNKEIYIQDNVPYIYLLNKGKDGQQWSKQSPIGYVERILEMVMKSFNMHGSIQGSVRNVDI